MRGNGVAQFSLVPALRWVPGTGALWKAVPGEITVCRKQWFSDFRVPVSSGRSPEPVGFQKNPRALCLFEQSSFCWASSSVLSSHCPEVPTWVRDLCIMKLSLSLLFSCALRPHRLKSPLVLWSPEVQQVYPGSVQLPFAVGHYSSCNTCQRLSVYIYETPQELAASCIKTLPCLLSLAP